MMTPDELSAILERITQHQQTEQDLEMLRRSLAGDRQVASQLGKYNVNIGEGKEIHIGDRIFQGADAEAIKEALRSVLQEKQKVERPKTILVLASSPTNEARLRLDKEVREIDEGLRRSHHREKFTLQQRWAVRPDDLRRALLDFNPEIVHFCGHGSGDDGLVLENDAGLAQLVPTEALANLFKRFATRGLECVVLNACYSKIQAKEIAEHIDYVVGMNSGIGDDAAIKFAVGFYDELGAGWSYEDAYHGGCDAIALQGIPEEHTPVFKNLKKVQLRATNSVDDLVQQERSLITWNDEAIQSVIEVVQKQLPKPTGIPANLPFSGVVEFVGRDAVMSQLHQMLQQNHRVAVSAIAGMGGVGKTELALQYAMKYQPTYPAGICWLSARGVDVATQIVQFGRSLLDLNPPEDVELVEQVTFCWRHWQSGEVLLVFDDVTDYAAIKPYLPPSNAPRFKVLITTRLRLGASVNRLELEVLDEAAALALLEPLVGSDRIQLEQDCTQQLCTQLGYLPLGLELVGRYLARKPDLSLAVMLQRLQSKRLAIRALCQTDADMTAQAGVVAAFELSWETLSESARPLGYLLSLFAAAPIPWSLVEQCLVDQDPETLEETRDSELLNLHLLQRTNPGTYRLHPLIRDFFQTKLVQSPHPDVLKRRFCQMLAEFAQQVHQVPTRKQILAVAPAIPHVAEVATLLQSWLSDDDLIAPYVGLGRFYKGQGAFAQAEPWFAQCLEVSQTRLDADHPHVATSLNSLAVLYWKQGRYSEAEPLYQRSLVIREQRLGADHPAVAESLISLATLYRDQGRYSKAEPLYQRSLTIWEQQLGVDHPAVAFNFNNRALLYRDQGRYSEAELLYQRSLVIKEQQLGADHPDVATSLNNLANLYRDQGRYSEAEPLLQRALDIWKRALGEAHPLLGRGLDNLAMLLHAVQGRDRVAEALCVEALEILDRGLGAEHPWTVRCRENLAQLRNPS